MRRISHHKRYYYCFSYFTGSLGTIVQRQDRRPGDGFKHGGDTKRCGDRSERGNRSAAAPGHRCGGNLRGGRITGWLLHGAFRGARAGHGLSGSGVKVDVGGETRADVIPERGGHGAIRRSEGRRLPSCSGIPARSPRWSTPARWKSCRSTAATFANWHSWCRARLRARPAARSGPSR